MEGGVETRDLRHRREALLEGIRERNFSWHVLPVKGCELLKFCRQRRCQPLRFVEICAAVNDAMAHRDQRFINVFFIDPADQQLDSTCVIRSRNRSCDMRFALVFLR